RERPVSASSREPVTITETGASPFVGETSSRLEHLGEALAIVRMDREDVEAHVTASRSSRGELFDPGNLCRASDARPVRQEDLDFQPRTDLRLLVGVDAHAAEARIDAAAAAEKAQTGAGEIHGCPHSGV